MIGSITPCLWFDGNAEEAARFYVSVFPNARIDSEARMGDGKVLTVTFTLNGLQFTALNGGPHYTFSGATSFVVPCETQAEIDHVWAHLAEGGREQQCGWVIDRFGVTWQVIPSGLGRMLGAPDREAAGRATRAMLSMVKFDLARLEAAFRAA